jgi:hypothetical protein
MADMVYVKTTIRERVSAPIAEQLCSDFLEWLDQQGFAVEQKSGPGRSVDERDFEELARDFTAVRVLADG